jgi:hypothetical protein
VGLWVVCKILSLLVLLKARRTAGEASMLVSLFNLSGWDCG